jgi:hypothetical protein
MADEEILQRIRTLVKEEHALSGTDTGVDHERLAHLEETLDQCWDLLRQRRARREFGEDESAAKVRDIDTVEHYRQ